MANHSSNTEIDYLRDRVAIWDAGFTAPNTWTCPSGGSTCDPRVKLCWLCSVAVQANTFAESPYLNDDGTVTLPGPGPEPPPCGWPEPTSPPPPRTLARRRRGRIHLNEVET